MTSRWYGGAAPAEPLTQGDLIWDCPVITWSDAPDRQPSVIDEHTLRAAQTAILADVVVMTQACDLQQNKVEDVILCAHWGLIDYQAQFQADQRATGQNPTARSWARHCDDIRHGIQWSRAMLNGEDDAGVDHRIVFFDQVYTMPRIFLESLSRTGQLRRVRLEPPYREHLSQAFARYFMRVGLPVDIEKTW